MARILALLGAAVLCALLSQSPDSSQVSTSSLWAEGSPDSWASAGIGSAAAPAVSFVCPMDRDVASKTPGYCPRCGMKLMAGIPDSKEYSVRITPQPRLIRPGENNDLTFHIDDPKTHQTVRDFEVVHEKFYHLFVVSQDLSFFLHTHPEQEPDENFHLGVRFPKPGTYRVLSDFYPKGGTPQLIVNTLLVPGGADDPPEPAQLVPDLALQHAENADVDLVMQPAHPVAGQKTLMFFRVEPNDGIEPYLGAMAHLLAASSDLIDMIHTHPLQASDHGRDYKELQFSLTFPSAGIYRVWVQTQRKGTVNTVAFNVPVERN